MLSYRTAIMAGAAACAISTAFPAAAETKAFDIPAQSARTGIPEFGRQSGLQVLAAQAAVGDQKIAALKGEFEPREALKRILASTNLTVASDDGRTVTLAPQSSSAGDGAETNVVQELVVTAQKKSENIQVVPIAISAFTQADLTTRQVAGGPDLMTQVPNMTFTKTNFSSYSIQIRGIGTQAISATTDPGVAVAFNNTPFVRNRFFEQEFYDLERVEVLRGPQGTLYGRNATAGVVNIISQKPTFTADAKLSGDIANYKSGRLEGMVNIPLVEDKVALRLAGAWTKRNGYSTNELNGNPIDGRDLWSTRTSLRVSPNDRINVNLIWEHFQENDDRLRSGKQLCKKDVVTEVGGIPVTFDQTLPNAGQSGVPWAAVQPTFSQGCTRESLYSPASFQTPNGASVPYYVPLGGISLPVALFDPYVRLTQSSDLRVIESTIDPKYRAKSDLGELQVSWGVTDDLTLSSETAYNADFVYSLEDFNRFDTAPGAWTQNGPFTPQGVLQDGPNGGIFCDPQLGCSDRLVAVDVATSKSRQFSQEFRLSSDYGGKFNFSLGANFLRFDGEDKYYVFINSLSLAATTGHFLYRADAGDHLTYVPGQSDNRECMNNGLLPGDPTKFQGHACVYIDPNPIESVNDQGHNYFLSKNPYRLISYAVFGEAYYNITDALKITAGLRWTVDKKHAPLIPTWVFADQSRGYPVLTVIDQEWREPTGRLAIDWKPQLSFTEQTLLYASYSHGYKAGGANPPPFAGFGVIKSVTRPRTFDPEFVDAFELGAKNTFADGKATLNLSAFYYDYKGYQISEIVDRSAFNRNFDATIWGLELESDWRPLKNLRLGFKGGYESTRIADGEQAIDLMDRTAGHAGWNVIRPFPTRASSCILPTWLYTPPTGDVVGLGAVGGGGPGGCELAYEENLDPVTVRPYVANPTVFGAGSIVGGYWPAAGMPGAYPGWDPSTAPNHGEGFFKQLGGNQLPNAPHFTGTITADYTVPLPHDWLVTLHTDLYAQSNAWWRVFNDSAYDKLHPYFTMNLAAIFSNEAAGWRVMAYVKNVLDRGAITGAFLNSDDTGLTTNVFLTEPRLYGLRVTKEWTGVPLWSDFGARHEGPYPFTVEIGGQIQKHDAPNDPLAPPFLDQVSAAINPLADQQNALDWGDGREVKLAYQTGDWKVALGARFGKTNGSKPWSTRQEFGAKTCISLYAFYCQPDSGASYVADYAVKNNYTISSTTDREEHTIVDFTVGRNVGLGIIDTSVISAGLSYADFESTTDAHIFGEINWNFSEDTYKYGTMTHDYYNATVSADREFKGLGPVLSWDASKALLGNKEIGVLGLDWSLDGRVLFGKQKTSIAGEQTHKHYTLASIDFQTNVFHAPDQTPPPIPIDFQRSKSVTVPTFGVSLGLSYKINRVNIGAGYRWERYFNAIDGGYAQRKSEDRTFDGPYFKVSVGFGG